MANYYETIGDLIEIVPISESQDSIIQCKVVDCKRATTICVDDIVIIKDYKIIRLRFPYFDKLVVHYEDIIGKIIEG